MFEQKECLASRRKIDEENIDGSVNTFQKKRLQKFEIYVIIKNAKQK